MKRTGSSDNAGGSRSSRNAEREPNERDLEERARRIRQWRIQLYRRAQEREKEFKNTAGRSSNPSSDAGRCRCRCASPDNNRREQHKASTSTNSVMSEKCQSSSNNARLFQGPEGTKIDLEKLRHIKVAIHRKLSAPETNVELQREILDPEAVKVKRRDGFQCPISRNMDNGAKVNVVQANKNNGALINVLFKQEQARLGDLQDGSELEFLKSSNAYDSSRRNVDGPTEHKSHKPASETDRGRSKDRRSGHEIDDRRYRSAPRRRSRDVSRDRRDRRRNSHSAERQSQRSETRNRSSRELLPRRDHRERSRDDSRERRNRDDRSRERRIQVPPHHYAEAMPVPLYYESFPPRSIMIGPMMSIGGQIPPMGRGGMRPLMGPMRPPYPPRFFPHEMYRSNLHPNPRMLKKAETEDVDQKSVEKDKR